MSFFDIVLKLFLYHSHTGSTHIHEVAMNDLILHPSYSALLQEIETLKSEIVSVRAQMDLAENVEVPMLKARYNEFFGELEMVLIEKYYLVRLLKRELELIQAQINKGATPDIDAISAIIEAEAAEYQTILDNKAAEMQALSQTKFTPMPKEQHDEIRRVYQKIVKALHPDLNAGATKEDLECLQQAVEAFAEGDVATLDAIAAILEFRGKFQDVAPSGSLEELEAKRAKLFDTLSNLAQKLKNIRSSFPFDCKDLLESPEKIKAKAKQMEADIANFEAIASDYKNRLEQLQGRSHE